MNKLIKKAFTLIELLVVIAIIGILSGLIVVSMGGMTTKATIAKAQVFSNSLRNSLMMNLVSDWNFDGSGVLDNSAVNASYLVDMWKGENGTVTAAPPTVLSGSNCISGSCLNFNGSQYVSIADDPIFDFGTQMTAMVWVKGSNPGAQQGIFEQYDYGANKRSWIMYHDSPSPGKLRVILSDDGTANSGHYKQYNTTSVNILDGNWHLAGFTWNSGVLKLYVDGVEAAVIKSADNAITALYNSDVNLTIGSFFNSGSPAYYFTGQIDEARLYNAAISTSQIREQYYVGLNKLLNSQAITKAEYLSKVNNLLAKN